MKTLNIIIAINTKANFDWSGNGVNTIFDKVRGIPNLS